MRVLVVGAGVIGLTVGVRLAEAATTSMSWDANCHWRRRRQSLRLSGTRTGSTR